MDIGTAIINFIINLFTQAPKDLWIYLTFGALGAAIGTMRRISKKIQIEAEKSLGMVVGLLEKQSAEELGEFLDEHRAQELRKIVRTSYSDYKLELISYIIAGAFLAALIDHHYILSAIIGLTVGQILDFLDWSVPPIVARLVPQWLKTFMAKQAKPDAPVIVAPVTTSGETTPPTIIKPGN